MKVITNIILFFCIVSCIGMFLFAQNFKTSQGDVKEFNLSLFVHQYDNYANSSAQKSIQNAMTWRVSDELGLFANIVNFLYTPIKLVLFVVNLMFDCLNIVGAMFGFVFS